ncbi:hypothetical protein D3C84_939900 [compost metagenome]
MHVGQFQAIAGLGQRIFLEQLTQDRRHAELMKHPAATLAVEVLNIRHQHQLVADAMQAAMLTAGAVNKAVNAAVISHGQKGRLLQHRVEVHRRCKANDFNVESIRLVQAFSATELQYLQAQSAVEEGQGVETFLVVVHRTRFYHGVRTRRVRNHAPQ